MTVGITGPIEVHPLLEHLDPRAQQYAEWGHGGAQVTQLTRELVRRGYPTVVVTLDPRAQSEVILEGPNLRVCIGTLRPRIRHRMLDVFGVERRYLRNALRRESPDIIHAHWTYEYALAALATDLPTLTTIRDWAPTILRNTPPWPYRLLRLFMALFVFWNGDHFTANSPYIASKVQRWFGWNIPVIPNALEDGQFIQGQRLPNLDEPTFVSINNGFGPRKNVQTLLKAFHRVVDDCPGARLHLFGADYGTGEQAQEWAASRKLTEQVQFHGKVPHETVVRTLRDAEVLVHPAREESFGNTLVEAMAQKTPVIAGRESGAVPWVLDHGRSGLLTNVTSAEAVATSMLSVVRSEQQWRKLSEAGYRRAKRQFRLSATTDRFVDLYRHVVSGRE